MKVDLVGRMRRTGVGLMIRGYLLGRPDAFLTGYIASATAAAQPFYLGIG